MTKNISFKIKSRQNNSFIASSRARLFQIIKNRFFFSKLPECFLNNKSPPNFSAYTISKGKKKHQSNCNVVISWKGELLKSRRQYFNILKFNIDFILHFYPPFYFSFVTHLISGSSDFTRNKSRWFFLSSFAFLRPQVSNRYFGFRILKCFSWGVDKHPMGKSKITKTK